MDKTSFFNNNTLDTNEPLSDKIVGALIQFFYMVAFILVICPFNFWKKSVINLDNARKNSSWDFASKSPWPFFSFVKAIMLNFVYDGLTFISWAAGTIYAFTQITDSVKTFLSILVCTYYLPILIAPLRDLFVISLLPLRKFLSWCSKPAQQLDIDMRQR